MLLSAAMLIIAGVGGVANMKSYDIIQINYEKSDRSDTKAD